jgi:hypothetical protein
MAATHITTTESAGTSKLDRFQLYFELIPVHKTVK